MRTLIYARYSSHNQQAHSIEDQLSICRARADREGWHVQGVYTDAAISGAAGIESSQRPGLNALLSHVERGGIDLVLAEATDRIARHQGDAFAIRERIQFAGARLFTVMDGEVDELTGTIKGLIDARYRADLGARMRLRKRERASLGHAQSVCAYGYRRANRLDEKGDLVRGLREIDPDQADIVRRIYREFAAGMSAMSIAARLNEEGVPPPKRGIWRASSIRGERSKNTGILANSIYVGRPVHGRTMRVMNPKSRRHQMRKSDLESLTADVPGLRIVDDALWEAVQRELEVRSGKQPEAHRRPKHPLSGLGRCGVCGGNWIIARASGGRRNWGCAAAVEHACTNRRLISTAKYERRVFGELKAEMLDPEVVAAFVREYHREHARQTADLDREHSRLDRKIAETARRIDRLVEAIADGGSSFAQIRDTLATTRADHDRLTKERASLAALPVLALHPGLADQYRRQVEELAQLLADPDASLEAVPRLRALIDHIELWPSAGARGVDLRVVRHIDEVLRMTQRPDEVLSCLA